MGDEMKQEQKEMQEGVFSSPQSSQEGAQDTAGETQGTKKKPIRAIIGCLLVVAVFLLIQVLVSAIGSTVIMVPFMQHYTGDDVAVAYQEYVMTSGLMTNILAITTLICAGVALLWYKLGVVKKYTAEKKQAWKDCMNPKTIAMLILFGLICYVAALVIASVVEIVSPNTADEFNELMGSALGGNAIIAIVTTVILAPIAEEVMVRGIIFHKLSRNLPVAAAIVIQALLFSFYHLNVMQALYVLPIGLALGYTAYKLHSVVPCIIIHAVNNLFSSVVGALPEQLQSMYVMVGFGAVCCVLFYVLLRSKRSENMSL